LINHWCYPKLDELVRFTRTGDDYIIEALDGESVEARFHCSARAIQSVISGGSMHVSNRDGTLLIHKSGSNVSVQCQLRSLGRRDELAESVDDFTRRLAKLRTTLL
jgi:hypothetical protein